MWGMTDLTKENLSLSFPPIGANFPTPSFLTLRIALILNSHSLSHSSSLTHTLSLSLSFLLSHPPWLSHVRVRTKTLTAHIQFALTHTLPSSLLARFFSFFLIHTLSHSRSLSHFHSHAHTHTHTLSLFLSDTLSLTALAAIITDASEQHPFFSAAAPPSSFLPRLHRDQSERTLRLKIDLYDSSCLQTKAAAREPRNIFGRPNMDKRRRKTVTHVFDVVVGNVDNVGVDCDQMLQSSIVVFL